MPSGNPANPERYGWFLEHRFHLAVSPCLYLEFGICSDIDLVFGRNIPYEITIAGQAKPEPTRTFSHFRKLPRGYSRPAANEVLHVRDDGYEYLALERRNGATRIIAGTLQCLAAELAYPLFAKHGKSRGFSLGERKANHGLDSSTLFKNMIFCGTMLVGNARLLETLFRQIRNCEGKPEQQLK